MDEHTIATVGTIFFLLFALIWLALWVLTLIHQAKRRRWVWFVFTIIFQLTASVYWFVWLVSPEFKKKKVRK